MNPSRAPRSWLRPISATIYTLSLLVTGFGSWPSSNSSTTFRGSRLTPCATTSQRTPARAWTAGMDTRVDKEWIVTCARRWGAPSGSGLYGCPSLLASCVFSSTLARKRNKKTLLNEPNDLESCFKPHNRATERRNFACIAVASHTPREVRTLYVQNVGGSDTPYGIDRSLSSRAAPRGCRAERTARLHGAPPDKCALTSPTAQSGRGPRRDV